MSDTATVLRRKVGLAQAGSDGGPNVVDAALRLSIPRAADELLSMDVLVVSVAHGTSGKASLLDGIDETDLVYLIEAGERRGICKVSSGLLAALTEMQMSGRITSSAPPSRAPTRTDGIVAAQIIDTWMAAAVAMLEADGRADDLVFFEFKRLNSVLNRRNTDLTIDPCTFSTVQIELSLGGGAKTGTLSFAVPEGCGSTASDVSELVMKHLPTLEAKMRAVLLPLPLNVDRARKLAKGDLLELPADCLSALRIEGLDGRLIGSGKLGQLNGYRAVRLAPPRGDKASLVAAPAAAAGLPAPEISTELTLDTPTGLTDLPDLPDAQLPNLPSSGGEEGALPDLPNVSDGGGLPELPDLPDLPDLPNLPGS
ncbi:MAG: FliM/FliN family flagellar motor C-terminal domain-containing protein [Pseudomonadota bacterium]